MSEKIEKITVGQMGELVTQSEQGRITREMLQRFLENPSVVFGNVPERMLKACKFDWVNDSITPENFPIIQEPDPGSEYEFVCLEKYASTDDVEAEIKRRGLEPGDLADLLLYVRKNMDEQRKSPIVALASRWQYSVGGWYSPYASGWFGGRNLDLHYRELDWGGDCRFLARKPR